MGNAPTTKVVPYVVANETANNAWGKGNELDRKVPPFTSGQWPFRSRAEVEEVCLRARAVYEKEDEEEDTVQPSFSKRCGADDRFWLQVVGDTIYLAFAGSEPTIRCWFSEVGNLQYWLVDFFCDPAMKVHSGFHEAYCACQEDIRLWVERMLRKHKAISRILCVGHSRGGALATLAAAHFAYLNKSDKSGESSKPLWQRQLDLSVVTFASPRVGDPAFVKCLQNWQVRPLRMVQIQDPVPRLPLETMGFTHFGEAVVLDSIESSVLGSLHDGPVHPHSIFSYEDNFLKMLSKLPGKVGSVVGNASKSASKVASRVARSIKVRSRPGGPCKKTNQEIEINLEKLTFAIHQVSSADTLRSLAKIDNAERAAEELDRIISLHVLCLELLMTLRRPGLVDELNSVLFEMLPYIRLALAKPQTCRLPALHVSLNVMKEVLQVAKPLADWTAIEGMFKQAYLGTWLCSAEEILLFVDATDSLLDLLSVLRKGVHNISGEQELVLARTPFAVLDAKFVAPVIAAAALSVADMEVLLPHCMAIPTCSQCRSLLASTILIGLSASADMRGLQALGRVVAPVAGSLDVCRCIVFLRIEAS